MGDINLLDRINRLSKKIGGAIFPSDKASKSAFGIVKIGDNINVSSGKISVPEATADSFGVVKLVASGVTCDKLFDDNIGQGSTTEKELSSAYTNYSFLVFVKTSGVNVEYGYPMIVDAISTGANNMNASGVGSIRFNSEDATKFYMPQGSGTIALKVYGIK